VPSRHDIIGVPLGVSPLARASIVLLSWVVAAACTASYPTAPTQATPLALQIVVGAVGPVPPGSTFSFQSYTVDTDGAYALVTASWVSSDTTVLQPTSLGTAVRLTAVAPGAANITARYEGLAASVPLIVINPQLRTFPLLSIDRAGAAIIDGDRQPRAFLQPNLFPGRENVTNRVTWTSADRSVATINETGAIRRVGIGTTLITASLGDLTDWYWLSFGPS
jgi:hypothetical protein